MIKHLSGIDVARYSEAAEGHPVVIPVRQRRHLLECEQCRAAVMTERRRKETIAMAFRRVAGSPSGADLSDFRRRLRDAEQNPIMLVSNPDCQTVGGARGSAASHHRILAAVGALFTAGILLLLLVHRPGFENDRNPGREDRAAAGAANTPATIVSDLPMTAASKHAAVVARALRRDSEKASTTVKPSMDANDEGLGVLSSSTIDERVAAMLPPLLRAEFMDCVSDARPIDEMHCTRIVGRARYVSESSQPESVAEDGSDSLNNSWPAIEAVLYRRRMGRSTLEH